jgi:hypothetical protein
MSIPVDIEDLPEAMARFAGAYLLTTVDGRVKVVHARPALVDGVLRIESPGRGSLAKATANPVVTLVWPPLESDGPTLLVDGAAVVDGDAVLVTPETGVLHVQRHAP